MDSAHDRNTEMKGKRIEMHPATDAWMRGDRYGEIIGYGKAREYVNTFTGKRTMVKPYRVRLDKSQKIIRVHPENVSEVF